MNKRSIEITLLAVVFLLLMACQPAVKKDTVPDHHSAKTSLDWAGVYQGTLPCASCPGIKTLITLNPDGEFIKEEHYINTQGSYVEKGQFEWQPDGTVIHLKGDDVEAVNYYKVVENALLHLNADEQVIGGEMAELYRLEKITMTLQQTDWQLTEVVNSAFKNDVLSRVSMNFDDQGRLSGQAPCNRFFADYTASDNSVHLDKIGATKMACPFLKEEQVFFTQLAKVDNYEIKQTSLLLKKGDEVLLTFNAALKSE